MTKLFPFASVSWLALHLSACGGGDGDPPIAEPHTEAQAATDTDPMDKPTPTLPPATYDNGYAELDLSTAIVSPKVTPSSPTPFELSWRSCGISGTRTVECAELQVPLDYDNPESERILIALNRIVVPADVERRGTLLYNPGGPGGSGKEVARVLASIGSFDAIAPGFDIVGFDPRGVGDSSALECEFIDDFLAGDTGTTPEDAMMEMVSEYGLETAIEDWAWLSEQCRDYWGELFDHMGSNDVVRDIDAIRAALGEEKLNFLGASYGTRLGALYAQTFPERVRAIVLDAPVAPRASIVEQVQGQFDELLVVHEAFFTECDAGRIACPPDARALFDAFVASADSLGILSQMLDNWQMGLSYSFGTDYLPFVLDQQATQPTAEWMYGHIGIFGDADTSGFIQLTNINCSDNAGPLLSIAEANARIGDAIARSPLFAGALFPIVTCNGWSATPNPVAPLTAPFAPPLLVIAGTHDLRTPTQWGRDMADSLESGVLLVSEHWGHTIAGAGSECVDGILRDYFVNLALPAEGTVCPAPPLTASPSE
jgi:pimeloyl-ACP methyl ester carboxylesterase